ncbi:hypothetical protein JRO89_XS07G0253300 [Xanthoceras sorbifolium]|uniref:Probable magnesium transporter n=1 Tax=Xanthoceras sorbifolium TaxID=99658 RepID=A0ABQ8HV75_9ROSI|nr:hypothetical protein JRO89_XS07G0253300 [Xanthoceras sorbifolium]
MEGSSRSSWTDSYRGMSSANIKGMVLALSSSFFIGVSFIVKKKGLKKAAASGVRAGQFSRLSGDNIAKHKEAKSMLNCFVGFLDYNRIRFRDLIVIQYLGSFEGVGGYSYLYEPLWWVGMITSIACPSIIPSSSVLLLLFHVPVKCSYMSYKVWDVISDHEGSISVHAALFCAALAHIILRERLHIFGVLGCVLCVVGSTTIVLHAPQEREIESVKEVWDLATEPGFLLYAAFVVAAVFIIIIRFIPHYGQTHVMVYIGVCSLVGSLSVMSVKALGIALKLTFSGMNQLVYPQTWAFTLVVLSCVITQMNYLNKALDTFNTAVVSPIYYVMFTSLTILASVIMFKDWDRQNPTQIVTEMCGFVTILSGTFLLHKTKDMVDGSSLSIPMRLLKQDGFDSEGIPLRRSLSIPMHLLKLPEEDGFGQESIPLRRHDMGRSS